jgi:hypothetical protein
MMGINRIVVVRIISIRIRSISFSCIIRKEHRVNTITIITNQITINHHTPTAYNNTLLTINPKPPLPQTPIKHKPPIYNTNSHHHLNHHNPSNTPLNPNPNPNPTPTSPAPPSPTHPTHPNHPTSPQPPTTS